MPRKRRVEIRTDSITLGALLKWSGVVGTGGEAKALIASRRVIVNGQPEFRRGRQLVDGDLVAVPGGPTLVVARAKDASPPQTLAANVP